MITLRFAREQHQTYRNDTTELHFSSIGLRSIENSHKQTSQST
jgi:hypothetical protein